MKRTAFKRKTPLQAKKRPSTARKPLKMTTGLNRKSKTPEAKLKAKLWELCKKIIRLKYGNTCYTCNKNGLMGGSWHTGHFIPSSTCGAYLRYDLRNLRPQCYYCNINLGGNGSAFYRRLVDVEGNEYVDSLFRDRQVVLKANSAFYENLIAKYTLILAEMQSLSPIS